MAKRNRRGKLEKHKPRKQMLDGRWLVLPRHTQPEKEVQAMLDHLHMTLPAQPPPRIKASQAPMLPALPSATTPSMW